jgi:RNA polymerase sigma factor for flagellar operon FliA
MSTRAATLTPEAHRRPLDRRTYERFLPMIRRVAMRMVRKLPPHIAIEDLIGDGCLGLMEAYEHAPSDMVERELELFASYRIRGAMIDYLRARPGDSRSATGVQKACRDSAGADRNAPATARGR